MSTESSSSAQVLKKTQPEEFDLVILGVARARPSLRGLLPAKESESQSSSANTSAGHARTSRACRARMSSTGANVASYFRRSKEFGITHDGFAIDMADVRERKRRMVRGLNDMYTENYRNTGAEFILGTGRFLAPRTVEVTLADGITRQLRGANVIVTRARGLRSRPFPALRKRSRSRISRLLNSIRFPNTCLLSVGATSGWRCPRRSPAFGFGLSPLKSRGLLGSWPV